MRGRDTGVSGWNDGLSGLREMVSTHLLGAERLAVEQAPELACLVVRELQVGGGEQKVLQELEARLDLGAVAARLAH